MNEDESALEDESEGDDAAQGDEEDESEESFERDAAVHSDEDHVHRPSSRAQPVPPPKVRCVASPTCT